MADRPPGAASVDGSIAVRVVGSGDGDPRTDGGSTGAVLASLASAAAEAAMALDQPRVVVTRARDDAAPSVLALVDRGLAPVSVPAIEIAAAPEAEVRDAIEAIAGADWIVVTSRNAVDALAAGWRDRPRPGRARGSRPGPRWAAVGPSVARSLGALRHHRGAGPGHGTSAALAEAMPDVDGASVLVLHGDLAMRRLARRLAERGASVRSVVVYRTLEAPGRPCDALAAALRARPAAVLLPPAPRRAAGCAWPRPSVRQPCASTVPCIAIGPTTAAAARDLGLPVVAESAGAESRTVADTVAAAVRQLQESS